MARGACLRTRTCVGGILVPDHRVLYLKLTLVSSSSTSGLTNWYAVPARGTSTRTGSTPATRRCRFRMFCDGAAGGGSLLGRTFDGACASAWTVTVSEM